MLRTALIALLAFTLAGCATVTMTVSCPADSTGVNFALQGSTVGNQALAMLGTAIGMGALPLKGTAGTGGTTATMTYKYPPIFGADAGSLTCISPPPAPGIFTPGPPPAIVH